MLFICTLFNQLLYGWNSLNLRHGPLVYGLLKIEFVDINVWDFVFIFRQRHFRDWFNRTILDVLIFKRWSHLYSKPSFFGLLHKRLWLEAAKHILVWKARTVKLVLLLKWFLRDWHWQGKQRCLRGADCSIIHFETILVIKYIYNMFRG